MVAGGGGPDIGRGCGAVAVAVAVGVAAAFSSSSRRRLARPSRLRAALLPARSHPRALPLSAPRASVADALALGSSSSSAFSSTASVGGEDEGEGGEGEGGEGEGGGLAWLVPPGWAGTLFFCFCFFLGFDFRFTSRSASMRASSWASAALACSSFSLMSSDAAPWPPFLFCLPAPRRIGGRASRRTAAASDGGVGSND